MMDGANLLSQCLLMIAAHTAIHLSMIPNKNNPIQVPAIDPALVGTHPRNSKLSPDVKWRYDSIFPAIESEDPPCART